MLHEKIGGRRWVMNDWLGHHSLFLSWKGIVFSPVNRIYYPLFARSFLGLECYFHRFSGIVEVMWPRAGKKQTDLYSMSDWALARFFSSPSSVKLRSNSREKRERERERERKTTRDNRKITRIFQNWRHNTLTNEEISLSEQREREKKTRLTIWWSRTFDQ